MKRAPLKYMPVVAVLYLAMKHSPTVEKVEVVEDTPQGVVIKYKNGCRREKWKTLLHEYFRKFEDAKEWVRHELVTERNLARANYWQREEDLDKLQRLEESDL